MNYTADQAFQILSDAKFNSVESIFDVVRNTSGQVLGANSSSQYLLYTDFFDGGATHAGSVANAINDSGQNVAHIKNSEETKGSE